MGIIDRKLLWLALSGAGAANLSGADALLDGEAQGLAFDFTDQSVRIIDTSTPSNSTRSTGIVNQGSLVGPSGKLVYTNASNKLTLQSDGVMRYQAHNLILQSEDFATSWVATNTTVTANATAAPDGTTTADLIQHANTTSPSMRQDFTTVAGATYVFRLRVKSSVDGFLRFIVTDVGLVNLYGGWWNSATGSWATTAAAGSGYSVVGTPTSTAVGDGWYDISMTVTVGTSSTRLFLYLTDSDNTSVRSTTPALYFWGAHVYRYPANTDYIRTTSAAKYALPIEYDTSGNCLGLLVEEQRTNLCLYSNDLTQAGSWTASNMTTAKTATGPDNVANSATTITATAGNATILQAITSASAARVTSVYIKRRTGTGNIDLTQDNGSTWTTQAVDSTWTRFSLSSVTSANPTVGIRIVTSGDAVDVALFSHEVGAFVTSPILTYGAAATRSADNISIATSAFPYNQPEGSLYAEFISSVLSKRVFELSGGSAITRVADLYTSTSNTLAVYGYSATQAWSSTSTATWVQGSAAKVALAYKENDAAIVLNAGSAVLDTTFTPVPTATTLYIGKNNGSGAELNGHIKAISYVPRRKSNAELQAETA